MRVYVVTCLFGGCDCVVGAYDTKESMYLYLVNIEGNMPIKMPAGFDFKAWASENGYAISNTEVE